MSTTIHSSELGPDELAAAKLSRAVKNIEEATRLLRARREQLERTLDRLEATLPPLPTPRPTLRVMEGGGDA
jgi:ABC-type transporter Mla subunit MlaD